MYIDLIMYMYMYVLCMCVHHLSEASEDGGGSEGEMPSEALEGDEEEEERDGEANDSMSLKAELLKVRNSYHVVLLQLKSKCIPNNIHVNIILYCTCTYIHVQCNSTG